MNNKIYCIIYQAVKPIIFVAQCCYLTVANVIYFFSLEINSVQCTGINRTIVTSQHTST